MMSNAGTQPEAESVVPGEFKISGPYESQRVMHLINAVVLISLAMLFAFPGLASAQTDCIDGMAGEFRCKNVDLLSHVSLHELGEIGSGNDNWGWKDPQTGRYYALMGMALGTGFVDVTDPVNPVFLGKMLSNSRGPLNKSIIRDIKTYANHAFVVAGIVGHGMQVFDLTRLRNVDSPQTFEPDAVYTEIGDAHNIAINEETGYAYLVAGTVLGNCSGGMHIVDISTPKSPTQAGCYGATGRIHDTQCVIYRGPHEKYQGAEICFASNNPNLSIIDVSDKNDISLLGQTTWPHQAFAHQGWLSEDQRYFLMGDEGDEWDFGVNTRTIVLDVSDLEQPVYIGSHLADTIAIDHNQYVKGNLLYQANNGAGLRILRFDDLAAAEMTEVAWFDTFPGDDGEEAVADLGAWNVYPFFDNGTLLVSDHENGLFILRSDISNEIPINAGHSGAWFNPATSGQGQFIDVEPEEKFMFVSWFTYTDAASDNPNEQHWFTAQGNYSGNTAELALFETLGGRFDDPQGVTTTQIGEVSLSFSECGLGQMTYSLDEEGLQGTFPLLRVIPGSGNVCEERSDSATQAVDINAGMDGAWFDPNTPGQGFFIDAHPDPEGGNFIFVSWFTYGDDTASGQRWLTAQGSFEGSIAELDVFETTGGSFDDPLLPSTVKVGTLNLDFTDCVNIAQVTYSLPDDGVEGDMAIIRVLPGRQALCEELSGAE